MDSDKLFEDFVKDLEELHYLTRKFHNKWVDVQQEISISPQQKARLDGIWDQHDAWYKDKQCQN